MKLEYHNKTFTNKAPFPSHVFIENKFHHFLKNWGKTANKKGS